MSSVLPEFNPETEAARITTFLQETVHRTGVKTIVLGLSGGIDSAVSLYLLRKALPDIELIAVHLYYDLPHTLVEVMKHHLQLSDEQVRVLSINPAVTTLAETADLIDSNVPDYVIRLGNIMARTRMIILYDKAKKHNALVCGTENRSEHLLGYFTRHGDGASDIEPIRHIYKTNLYKLAEYLTVPERIITQAPSAGLWRGQTDELELGFPYAEADQVLYLLFDQNTPLEEIKTKGFPNAEKIIARAQGNIFKHQVPYTLDK